MGDDGWYGAAPEAAGLVTVPPAVQLPTLAEDVMAGLFSRPRTLPPKYFYDARGSELFDRICATREYYPTRTEAGLLADAAPDIARRIKPAALLELGAGAARKTGPLLAAFGPDHYPCYMPFDICPEIMTAAGRRLQRDYPGLHVQALVGDYHAGFAYLPKLPQPTLWAFLGGTIGNFEAEEARAFLESLHQVMAPGDALLLGADRLKERTMLEAAYNDKAGWTAAFNLNVLNVLNRELDADFELQKFHHQAWFEPSSHRIEMHLVSDDDQTVQFGALDRELRLAEGETIRTEISRKFSEQELEHLVAQPGFRVIRHYEADEARFSLVLAAR